MAILPCSSYRPIGSLKFLFVSSSSKGYEPGDALLSHHIPPLYLHEALSSYCQRPTYQKRPIRRHTNYQNVSNIPSPILANAPTKPLRPSWQCAPTKSACPLLEAELRVSPVRGHTNYQNVSNIPSPILANAPTKSLRPSWQCAPIKCARPLLEAELRVTPGPLVIVGIS